MRFHGVCLITRDLAGMRDFYGKVLGAPPGPEDDEAFVLFQTAGAALSLYVEQGMERTAPGSTLDSGHGTCVLEFEVTDVDAEHRRLEELRVPILKRPTPQPWGRRSVWFRDPDGNVVNFYCKVEVQRTTESG